MIVIYSRYSWICRLHNTIDRSSNGNFMPSWITFNVSREEQKVPTCSRRNMWLCKNLDFLNQFFTTWLISIVPRALLFLRHNDPNNDISYWVHNIKLITYHSSKWLILNHLWNELKLAAVLHVPSTKWFSLVIEPHQMSVKQKLSKITETKQFDCHHQHTCLILVAVTILLNPSLFCLLLSLLSLFQCHLAFRNFTLTGHLLKKNKVDLLNRTNWYNNESYLPNDSSCSFMSGAL